MDDDGYIRITGRIKEMIIRGGENIYPREIEEFLHTCPAIADVQVIGIPDAKYGEEVMAWVKLKRPQTLKPASCWPSAAANVLTPLCKPACAA